MSFTTGLATVTAGGGPPGAWASTGVERSAAARPRGTRRLESRRMRMLGFPAPRALEAWRESCGAQPHTSAERGDGIGAGRPESRAFLLNRLTGGVPILEAA